MRAWGVMFAASVSLLLAASAVAAPPTAQPAPPAPPPIEAYGRLPAIGTISLSPSGDKFVSVGNVNGKRMVLARTLTGQVLMAAPVDDHKVRNVVWADEDHVLVTISGTTTIGTLDNFEVFFTLNMNLKTRKADWLFDRDPRFLVFNYGMVQSLVLNGKPYAYFRNTPREGISAASRLADANSAVYNRFYPDLYKIDLTTNALETAARGTESVNDWVVGPDGTIVAFSDINLTTNDFIVFHGQTPIYKANAPRLTLGLMGMGRTADSVLVYDNASATSPLVEVRTNGASEALFPGENIRGWYQSPVTGLLTGVLIGDHTRKFFDKTLQARADAAVKPFAGRVVGLASWTEAMDKIIVHTDGDSDSGTYWLVDLAAHKADIIDNDYPDVGPDQTGPVRRIDYKASDGFELDGVLTLPPGGRDKNLPVVIMPHGGPIGIYDIPTFNWMAQAFASRGYAVFQPNYRGSGGHGSAYEQAGYGEFGRKMLTDISDGLAALGKAGFVDPKRACIVGFSYGGYAAMAGITVQQGLYRCAVAGEGPSDLPAMLTWEEERHGWKSGALKFWREAMGLKQPGAPSLASISPALLAGKADAPLLLIHGRDDSVVPLTQSQTMERVMKAAAKPVELLVTQGEDHWLSNEAMRIQTLKAAVEFVQKHNPAG